jgi:hypothetical protein
MFRLSMILRRLGGSVGGQKRFQRFGGSGSGRAKHPAALRGVTTSLIGWGLGGKRDEHQGLSRKSGAWRTTAPALFSVHVGSWNHGLPLVAHR